MKCPIPSIILPPDWQGKEQEVTPASVYRARRSFLKTMGMTTLGMVAGLTAGCEQHTVRPLGEEPPFPVPESPLHTLPMQAPYVGLPAPRNTAYTVSERPLTQRLAAASHNNFYEFSDLPQRVWQRTGRYEPFPWTIQVDGLVQQDKVLDVEALLNTMPLEERIYRHRCVEAWAMTVPWTGFPLARLIEACRPLSRATHIRFESANRPDQMPGIEDLHWYPWPYYEGLRMDEAMNDLAFVVTGLYGEPLLKQHGAPLRIVLPWKYGFKGPKAVARITFVDRQPGTFWSDLIPGEYTFLANVNPHVPHPRWSQADERLLGEEGRVSTLLFNGYDAWVGALYPDEPRG